MNVKPLRTPESYGKDIDEMMLSAWRMAMILNGQEGDVASPYISAMQNLPVYVMKNEKNKEKALSQLDILRDEFYTQFYFPQIPTNFNNLDGLGHVASIEKVYKEAKQKINECS